MFKKGQVVRCISVPGGSNLLEIGKKYTVAYDQCAGYLKVICKEASQSFFADRFVLVSEEKEDESYTLKLSSPYLINYTRMYDEVMVKGTRVAKVTLKIEGTGTQYVLLIHDDILHKATYQLGGQEILDDLKELGIERGSISRTLTIYEWATAYKMVKYLVKLPLKKELKRDTIVTVKPLEV